MKFMWDNQETGHHKVLFHVQWDLRTCHYYMNAGAYDHEEEVLLYDGVGLKVEDVSEVLDKAGKGSLQNFDYYDSEEDDDVLDENANGLKVSIMSKV